MNSIQAATLKSLPEVAEHNSFLKTWDEVGGRMLANFLTGIFIYNF